MIYSHEHNHGLKYDRYRLVGHLCSYSKYKAYFNSMIHLLAAVAMLC